jgi:hypothetical protein
MSDWRQDIQQDDTQHNGSQYNALNLITQYNGQAPHRAVMLIVAFFIVMLSVIMLNVVMLIVLATSNYLLESVL